MDVVFGLVMVAYYDCDSNMRLCVLGFLDLCLCVFFLLVMPGVTCGFALKLVFDN